MISYKKAEMWSDILKAMAHPTRVMILNALEESEQTFSDLMKLFEFDKSTVSKHLTILKKAGIISSTKNGNETIFKLDVGCIMQFFKCADTVIETNIKKQQACLCS